MPDKEIESVVDDCGWVKWHRKVRNSALWKSKEAFDSRSAWVDLVMSASWEKSEVYEYGSKKVIKIEPGQVLTSLKSLAEAWKWSPSKVSRYLDNLQELGMITQERTTKYTMLTITNWEKYQGQNERPKKDAPKPVTKQEAQPAPPPAENPDKAWEDMTPAEQAAYLRR